MATTGSGCLGLLMAILGGLTMGIAGSAAAPVAPKVEPAQRVVAAVSAAHLPQLPAGVGLMNALR